MIRTSGKMLDLHEVTLAKPSRLALCERLEGRLVMPKKSKMVKASDEVAIRWKTRVLVAYETCETNDENGANVFSLEIQGTDTLATRVQSNLSFVRSCILTQSRNLLVMLHDCMTHPQPFGCISVLKAFHQRVSRSACCRSWMPYASPYQVGPGVLFQKKWFIRSEDLGSSHWCYLMEVSTQCNSMADWTIFLWTPILSWPGDAHKESLDLPDGKPLTPRQHHHQQQFQSQTTSKGRGHSTFEALLDELLGWPAKASVSQPPQGSAASLAVCW